MIDSLTWPKLFSLAAGALATALGLAGYLQRDAHSRTELVEQRVQALEQMLRDELREFRAENRSALERLTGKVDALESRGRR